MVSNAGYGLFGCVEELTDEGINHIIATNLTGSIRLIKTFLPFYVSRGTAELFNRLSMERGLQMLLIQCIMLLSLVLKAFVKLCLKRLPSLYWVRISFISVKI